MLAWCKTITGMLLEPPFLCSTLMVVLASTLQASFSSSFFSAVWGLQKWQSIWVCGHSTWWFVGYLTARIIFCNGFLPNPKLDFDSAPPFWVASVIHLCVHVHCSCGLMYGWCTPRWSLYFPHLFAYLKIIGILLLVTIKQSLFYGSRILWLGMVLLACQKMGPQTSLRILALPTSSCCKPLTPWHE